MSMTPVRVFTVEREYGSRGGEFAHDLAAHLGWRLLDAELVKAVADEVGVSAECAAQYDERLDPWYYRFGKVFWPESPYALMGQPEGATVNAESMMAVFRDKILSAAAVGNCVIVGRGAACALVGMRACFHIFVYSTHTAKREWFLRTSPGQAQHADQQIAAQDKRRAAAIRALYDQDWSCRSLYHMQINSGIGIPAMIASAEAAAGLTLEGQHTNVEECSPPHNL